MSKISRKAANSTCKAVGDHQKYLSRITKTFYYGKLPKTESLSFPVTEFAAELFSEAQKGKSLERLHINDAAKISRNACVSPCSLVLAMLYLEKLKNSNPDYLNKITPSDLFLVSLMVSCKFLFDDGEADEVFVDEWAASGGISVKELINLEKGFLKAMDWEVYVSEFRFWKKLNELEITLAAKQGASRGYFTYTELENLATTIEIHNLLQCVVAVSVILVATYTAGLLTILGSIFLASQVPGTSLYCKKVDVQANVNTSLIELNETKTAFNSKCVIRNVDAIDVLKTSILLASLKPNYTDNENNNDVQYITWDYWNIPVMDWLSKSSQFISNYTIDMPLKFYPYFLEISATNMKHIELEDQIHKATKTRIQDQMESSWHKEWISSINLELFFKRIMTLKYVIQY